MDNLENLQGDVVTGIDLREEAVEPQTGWAPGWYAAEVIEGFTSRKGTVIQSGTSLAKSGESYNAKFCFRLTNGTEQMTTFTNINYKVADFSPQMTEAIRNLRTQFAPNSRWEGFSNEQRASILRIRLANFQKGAGLDQLPLSSEGTIQVQPFIGKNLFVRLSENKETGYMEVSGYSDHLPKRRGAR